MYVLTGFSVLLVLLLCTTRLTLYFFVRCAVLEATSDFPCRIKDLASTNKVNLCSAHPWLLTPLLATLPRASGLRRPGSGGRGHQE